MSGEHALTVLLTRSEEDNAQTARVFSSAGLATASLPGILFTDPDDWAPADEAILAIGSYDGILFTSRHAVAQFLSRFDTLRPSGRHLFDHAFIAAVGRKTEAALTSENIRVNTVPDAGTVEGLLASLGAGSLGGKRFLFPKSSIAREVLPAELRSQGASVTEIDVYRTVPPDKASVEAVQAAIANGSIGCIAFFSPSAVRNVADMLGSKPLDAVALAAIGPTTASALENLGHRCDIISGQPDAAELAKMIRRHFSKAHTV